MDRRKFIRIMSLAGAAVAVPWGFDLKKFRFQIPRAYAFAQSPILTKFVDSLPGLTAAGANNLGQYLSVLTPNDPGNLYPGSDYYHVVAGQYQQKLHTNLPPTTLWGYAQDGGPGDTATKYLGGVIVATADKPVRLTVRNNLPLPHILPVDDTVPGANGIPGYAVGHNRLSTHLHGGFPPWISDGTPFQDFDPNGGYGPSAAFPPDMGTPPSGSYNYYWTNQQQAKFMWYHDHAMGITRLNAYAGLATGYVLTDSVEQNLINTGILPAPAQTVYMVLQDKSFNTDGSLWYPFKYEWSGATGRWAWGNDPTVVDPQALDPEVTLNTLVNPSLIPEAFLDTTIINGACYPYLEVQRRHYRFRILNGSQARFYNLQLYFSDPSTPSEVRMVPADGATYAGPYGNVTVPNDGRAGGVPDPRLAGPMITQIGTEGGFLPNPVALNNPPQPIAYDQNPVSLTFGNATQYTLLLAPAERIDLIIDFTDVPAGAKLILYSDAPGPFPMGDDRNDYYTGDPDNTAIGGAPSTLPGQGPNTRTLMQFRVIGLNVPAAASLNTLQNLALQQKQNVIFPPLVPLPENGAYVRRLTLNETFETAQNFTNPYYGRLIQFLGTTVVTGVDEWGTPIFYQPFMAGRGEVVIPGATEIWEIYNLTGDTHPIHFHLINCQILSRQTFDDAGYLAAGAAAPTGTQVDPTPFLADLPEPPDPNESGWKETVRMNPHTVTRVIAKFDLPKLPWPVPLSTRAADPSMPAGPNNPRINGYEYVWHCHILEHEEHDMMHPLVIRGDATAAINSLLLDDEEEL
jgi:spore coat protein A, manganese oxidase